MAHVVDTSIAAVKMSGGFSAPDFSSSDEEEDIRSRPRSNAVSQSDLGVSESTGIAFVPRSYGSGSDVPVSPKSQSGTDVIVDGSNSQSLSDDHDAKTKKNPSVQTRSDHDRIVSSEKSSASLSDDHPANKQCVIRKQSHATTSADCQQRLGRDQAGLKGSASVTDNDQISSPEILSSESSPVMVTQCSAQASKNQPAVNGSLSYASGTSAGSSSSLPEYYQQSRFNPFDCDIHLEEDHFSDNARDTYFGHTSSSPRSVQSSNLSDPWQDGVQPVEESDKVTFAELGLAEDHFAHPEGHFGLSRTEELELAISNCKELIQSAAPNSDRQKNLVRKLVQLRLKLQEIKEGPEPVEKDKVVVMGHRFQRKESRSSKYYCEKCNSIIWGVLQEWRRCTECGYRCHDKCVSQITRTCASAKVKENPTFILELCPRNPKGLAAQDFRCAECRAQISGSDGSEARLCEYNGRYYCELCHWNDLMYIPAQILHNWDFEKRKVCRASKQFLKLMMKRAVIRVQDVNPMLFNYVEQLNDIKNLREELLVMKKYIMACPTAMKAKFLLQLSSRPHFVECSDRYSLQDLLDSDDTLIPDLVQVHSSWAQHIKTDCELCQGRGFICELCTNAEVLFPFDNIAVVCSCCSSVMHRICFAQKVMCPKCERRRKRKEQEGTSDSGGS